MLPPKPPIAEDSVSQTESHQRRVTSPSPESPSSNVEDGQLSPGEVSDPPLPSEKPPPLPNEPVPEKKEEEDDGWEPVWDDTAQAFYFFNRITNVSQWENPRVPDASQATVPGVKDSGPPGVDSNAPTSKKPTVAGGYDPAIHGDYDPDADYAKVYEKPTDDPAALGTSSTGDDPAAAYAATGHFNRFTGRWQAADLNPDKFSDESKSKRQMNAFFDVDAAANAHEGRSLKAERSNKKLSKKELKAFKEKRREKKEEKRRAWLRD